jgi:hypothetical protein
LNVKVTDKDIGQEAQKVVGGNTIHGGPPPFVSSRTASMANLKVTYQNI